MALVPSTESQERRYLFEYRHEGTEWAIEVKAQNLDDAKARVRAMAWAQYRGEIALTVRIPGTGLFSRIGRLLGNFTLRNPV